MRLFLFSSLLLGSLFSCKNPTPPKRDVQAYFFPIEKLSDGLVYAYRSLNAPDGVENKEYWFIRTIETDSGKFLVSTFYDPFFQIRLLAVDKIVSNGTLLNKLFFYETDTLTGKSIQSQGEILSGNNFPFQVSDSTGIFLYSVKYSPPGDSLSKNYLIRNRRFLGDGQEFSFGNQALPTIRFGLSEVAGNEAEGAAELKGSGIQIFAKDLGLVYYKKQFGTYIQEFELVDTFSMDKFVELSRGAIPEN